MKKSIFKITMLGLFWATSIFTNMAYGTPPNMLHPGFGPSSIELSQDPYIGKTAVVTYTVTPKLDIPQAIIFFRTNDNVQIIKGVENKVIVVDSKTAKVLFSAPKDKPSSFSVVVKFIGSPAVIGIEAHSYGISKAWGFKVAAPFGMASWDRVIVDEKTGQMGTAGELKAKNPAAWGYDPFEGAHHDVGSIFSKNESRIKEMREINPELTDWEALYLWHDACWTPREGNMTEPEIAGELLKRGWLAKHRKEFGSGKVLLKSEERIDSGC